MIEQFTLSAAGSLLFGRGTFDGLDSLLAQRGWRRIALVVGNSFSRSDACASFASRLHDRKIETMILRVSGEPTVGSVDALSADVAASGCDAVVGIGGGSALDTAKAVSVMARDIAATGEHISVKRYLEGVGDVAPPALRLPLIAVPTTAGTGSEVTKNAVIAETGPGGFKKSLRHDSYVPDLAVIDPLLALSVPNSVTAASGLDAVTQLMEAYVSVKANPYTDSLTLEALALAGNALPRLLDAGADDVSLRGDMAYAAYISGVAMANAGLGYVHGVAGPLGGVRSIPHGIACGLLLAPVVGAMADVLERTGGPVQFGGKLDRIAEIWHVGDRRGVVRFLQNLVTAAALPGLGFYGFTQDDLIAIGSHAAKRNSPVSIDAKTMVDILLSLR